MLLFVLLSFPRPIPMSSKVKPGVIEKANTVSVLLTLCAIRHSILRCHTSAVFPLQGILLKAHLLFTSMFSGTKSFLRFIYSHIRYQCKARLFACTRRQLFWGAMYTGASLLKAAHTTSFRAELLLPDTITGRCLLCHLPS